MNGHALVAWAACVEADFDAGPMRLTRDGRCGRGGARLDHAGVRMAILSAASVGRSPTLCCTVFHRRSRWVGGCHAGVVVRIIHKRPLTTWAAGPMPRSMRDRARRMRRCSPRGMAGQPPDHMRTGRLRCVRRCSPSYACIGSCACPAGRPFPIRENRCVIAACVSCSRRARLQLTVVLSRFREDGPNATRHAFHATFVPGHRERIAPGATLQRPARITGDPT